MSSVRLVGGSVIAFVAAGAALVWATDVSTSKIQIKDNAKVTKRLVQVQSKDAAVTLAGADDPETLGASLHIYSATDDFCAILPGGSSWKSTASKISFNDKVTKNKASIGKGNLSVSIKSGVTYSLIDNGTQGAVNARVRFGSGTEFCLRCTTAKKNTASKYLAKNCVAAACDAEPSSCSIGTTTTTTPGSTTTTTTQPSAGVVLKGALVPTGGRFNYNLQLGLPGANAACNTNFPGTHACSYAELQSAATAGDLVGLKDTANAAVASFWAIDNAAPALTSQCQDGGGSGLNWEYGTAHTTSRGQKVALNNGAGTLGSLQTGLQCNFSQSNVGCCQ